MLVEPWMYPDPCIRTWRTIKLTLVCGLIVIVVHSADTEDKEGNILRSIVVTPIMMPIHWAILGIFREIESIRIGCITWNIQG